MKWTGRNEPIFQPWSASNLSLFSWCLGDRRKYQGFAGFPNVEASNRFSQPGGIVMWEEITWSSGGWPVNPLSVMEGVFNKIPITFSHFQSTASSPK